MRINKYINLGIINWSNTKLSSEHLINCMAESKENYQWDLWSQRVNSSLFTNQMLRVTWHLTSRYWCIQKRGSFALYNFTHLLGNSWFYCACVNQQWSRLHRTTKIICFICNSNRHFKIQSFNEAVPKYTQADPRRVSDVPKGVGVAKQKVLKEFMFQ